jgi:hypothetical protein
MKKIKLLLLALTIAAPLFAQTAQAQFAKPEDAIKYRQSVFTVLGNSFGSYVMILMAPTNALGPYIVEEGP